MVCVSSSQQGVIDQKRFKENHQEGFKDLKGFHVKKN